VPSNLTRLRVGCQLSLHERGREALCALFKTAGFKVPCGELRKKIVAGACMFTVFGERMHWTVMSA